MYSFDYRKCHYQCLEKTPNITLFNSIENSILPLPGLLGWNRQLSILSEWIGASVFHFTHHPCDWYSSTPTGAPWSSFWLQCFILYSSPLILVLPCQDSHFSIPFVWIGASHLQSFYNAPPLSHFITLPLECSILNPYRHSSICIVAPKYDAMLHIPHLSASSQGSILLTQYWCSTALIATTQFHSTLLSLLVVYLHYCGYFSVEIGICQSLSALLSLICPLYFHSALLSHCLCTLVFYMAT